VPYSAGVEREVEQSSSNTLGKYEIVREIARSNDIVYEARDPALNRRVALKELSIPPNLQGAQRRERIERFWREGKAAGRLSHPNIVTIYDVGKENDRHFIAMEFLEGQTLRDVLRAGGPLSIADARNYALQICSALGYAHSCGVVHRDIKPENVQILPGNHVKITDFGIARLTDEPSITKDGEVFGTPSYMSPEQVAGGDIDARSDIFSLGVLLYEMLAGEKPFAGDTVVTITYNITNSEPPIPPGVPDWMTAIVHKAMVKDREARYASVDAMAEDLTNEMSPSWFAAPQAGIPSPFGAPSDTQQMPIPPAGPYGAPDPTTGGRAISAPDPFAQAPAPQPVTPPSAPKPVMTAETRNFLGILFVSLAFAGMLIFAIWAVNLAYRNFVTASTSESASRYYEQGAALYEKGDIDGAVRQWEQAMRVSPDSQYAQRARDGVYAVGVQRANSYYRGSQLMELEQQAESLVKLDAEKPEGHFYLGLVYQRSGDIERAKAEYNQARAYGGNDSYGQTARVFLAQIYMEEGARHEREGNPQAAIAAYEEAAKIGDSQTIEVAKQRISDLMRTSWQ